MWPLKRNVPYEIRSNGWMHGKWTDKKWLEKPFKTDRFNGWTDAIFFEQLNECKSFSNSKVERLNRYNLFSKGKVEWLNGCSFSNSYVEWVNRCFFFKHLGSNGYTAEAKSNDKHYSVTRIALPHSSESNGSKLPCVVAKNISAVQLKRFSKFV